jgi:hypothetical protein
LNRALQSTSPLAPRFRGVAQEAEKESAGCAYLGATGPVAGGEISASSGCALSALNIPLECTAFLRRTSRRSDGEAIGTLHGDGGRRGRRELGLRRLSAPCPEHGTPVHFHAFAAAFLRGMRWRRGGARRASGDSDGCRWRQICLQAAAREHGAPVYS